MTTIAANREAIACDSRFSDDWGSLTVPSKLSVVGHTILGMAGDASAMAKFWHWLRAGGKRRRPRFTRAEEIEALLLTPGGLVYYDSSCEPIPLAQPFAAIGSGGYAALGAMYAGRGPLGAVRIACKIDKHSAPPVRVLRLRDIVGA